MFTLDQWFDVSLSKRRLEAEVYQSVLIVIMAFNGCYELKLGFGHQTSMFNLWLIFNEILMLIIYGEWFNISLSKRRLDRSPSIRARFDHGF